MWNAEQTFARPLTLLGDRSQFKGDLVIEGPLQIDSQMKGTITSKCPEASILITPQGSFEGTLNCHHVQIYGHFKGTIKSQDRVVIHSSSVVEGDIQTDYLEVHPGACVNIDGKTL